MKSGILSFNKGLFLKHIKSLMWVSIFFLLSQIVLLPLGILVSLRDEWRVETLLYEKPDNMLMAVSYSMQYVTYMVFPVLAGIILTSYMTKKGSSDFVHSLPFKRSTLLTHVYAAGGVSLLLPILLNTVLVFLMRPFVHPITYSAGDIAEWAGVSMFVVLFMFVVTVLIGLFVGPAILQGVMAYGILVLPAALIITTLMNARYFIKGLAAQAYTSKIAEEGIFLVRAASYENRPFTGTEWVVYFVILLLAMAASYYMYQKRPAEAVDETIVFPIFRWIFILVLTFAAMMIGGLYFGELLGGTVSWVIAGCIIGALAGYTILQMIVQKSLRLVWPWKGFVFYAVLIAVLLIPGAIFARSYEQALPEASDIEKVYIGDSQIPFENQFYMEEQKGFLQPDAGFMTGADSIEQVRSLHSELIEMENGIRSMENYAVTITYKMKDGSLVRRQYMADPQLLADAAEEIRSNPEFIKASNALFALKDPDTIEYLAVYNGANGIQMANVADQQSLAAIRKALEQDAMSSKAAMFAPGTNSDAGSVEFYIGKDMTQVNIYQQVSLGDEQTIKAIRSSVPDGQLFASAELVSEAYIVEAENKGDLQALNEFIWSEEETPDLKDMPLSYREVTDKAEIKKLLNPAGLTENSSRLLVLKWEENAGYSNITISGLKE
ncbi:ABC transporter permease [Domibacillus indicus]|uniref:ABC transporter permease n=1 Tax=Domibacillus indicus TaxID=1437523 RepID=UPI000617D926|nr:ABC transporter permease [Domibacillus indicus]